MIKNWLNFFAQGWQVILPKRITTTFNLICVNSLVGVLGRVSRGTGNSHSEQRDGSLWAPASEVSASGFSSDQ